MQVLLSCMPGLDCGGGVQIPTFFPTPPPLTFGGFCCHNPWGLALECVPTNACHCAKQCAQIVDTVNTVHTHVQSVDTVNRWCTMCACHTHCSHVVDVNRQY